MKRGRVLYEMEGVAPEVAREALRLASHKLPLKTRVLERTELWYEGFGVSSTRGARSWKRASVSCAATTYFEQGIKRSTGQLENVAELKAMKRDIARALTIQAEKRRTR